jgi:hypothetical protein
MSEADYAVNNGQKTRIDHIAYANPKTAGKMLKSVMQDIARDQEVVYLVYHIDDVKLFMFSSKTPKDQVFKVRLMELRGDGVGLDMGAKIPKVEEGHLLPLVTVERDGKDYLFNFHLKQDFQLNTAVVLQGIRQEVLDQAKKDVDLKLADK